MSKRRHRQGRPPTVKGGKQVTVYLGATHLKHLRAMVSKGEAGSLSDALRKCVDAAREG